MRSWRTKKKEDYEEHVSLRRNKCMEGGNVMYQLSEWRLSESNGDMIAGYANGAPLMVNVPKHKGAVRAHGIVKGHHRLPDGTHIHTSRIEQLDTEADEGRFVARTHSGSLYELMFEEIDGERISDTMKILGKYEVPEEVLKLCESTAYRYQVRKAAEEKENYKRRAMEADSTIRSEELYLVIGEKENYAFCRNDNGKMMEIEVILSVGMFDERYLIRIPDTNKEKCLDFHEAQSAQSYIIEPCDVRGLKTVCLKNECGCNAAFRWNKNTIMCKPGDMEKIDMETEETQT